MSIRTEAEENLRVIRSLMEKATVYRALSAPGALIGGAGALIVAAIGIWQTSAGMGEKQFASRFLLLWLGLLLLVTLVNLALLSRDARRRGEPFVSPGMTLALRAMLPALLAGGGLAIPFHQMPVLLVPFWVLLYGISLLAAAHFAPKSICWLGRAFFVVGFLLFASVLADHTSIWWSVMRLNYLPHLIMGATFGLFHLVYAVCTWPRGGVDRGDA